MLNFVQNKYVYTQKLVGVFPRIFNVYYYHKVFFCQAYYRGGGVFEGVSSAGHRQAAHGPPCPAMCWQAL
jgi:hypothetical protein